MFSLYLPILLLQAFCLYHAFTNDLDPRWYMLIMFLPLVGSLIYLFKNVLTTPNIENIAEEVKETINENYKIEKLEKESYFSDTIANRIKIADEYLAKAQYSKAAELYESCLEGFNANDPSIKMKLIQAYYMMERYPAIVLHGAAIKNDVTFKNSSARIAYAWALFHEDQEAIAEKHFQAMDVRFSNYNHRIEYCEFLRAIGRHDLAKAKLEEMKEEIEHMDSSERRMKRKYYREIQELLG